MARAKRAADAQKLGTTALLEASKRPRVLVSSTAEESQEEEKAEDKVTAEKNSVQERRYRSTRSEDTPSHPGAKELKDFQGILKKMGGLRGFRFSVLTLYLNPPENPARWRKSRDSCRKGEKKSQSFRKSEKVDKP